MNITDTITGKVTQLGYNVATGIASSALSDANRWLGKALGLNDIKGSKIQYYYDKDRKRNFKTVYAAPIGRYALQQAKKYAIEEGVKQLKKLVFGAGSKPELHNTIDLLKDNEKKFKKKHYGQLQVNLDKGDKDYVTAVDMRGGYCPTAFIMGIKLDQPIPYKTNNAYKTGKNYTHRVDLEDRSVQYNFSQIDTLVWFDCTALVSINSEKNIILTQVQGRDYTRKELVSNGDVKFSVSGRMCSNVAGVYPAEEVQKFIQIMNYKGIIRCNHLVLDQFGIDKFIITSWNLSPKQGFDNVQEYSFECVGIQPDRETVVDQDTIQILDYGIQTSSVRSSGWSKLFKEKLKNLKNGAIAGIADTANKAADIYINKALD